MVRNPDDGLASTGRSRTAFFYEGIFKTVRTLHDVQTPSGPKELRSRLQYDHQGRLVSVEELDEPSSQASSLRLQTSYAYDEGGRLVRVHQLDPETGQVQTRTLRLRRGRPADEGMPPGARRRLHRVQRLRRPRQPHPPPLRPRRRRTLRARLHLRRRRAHDPGAERPGRPPARGVLLQRLLRHEPRPIVPTGNGKLYQSKRHNDLGGLDVVATVTHAYAGIGGRLSRRMVTTGGDGDVPRMRFITDFGYDSLGDLASITYPGCAEGACGSSPPSRTIRRHLHPRPPDRRRDARRFRQVRKHQLSSERDHRPNPPRQRRPRRPGRRPDRAPAAGRGRGAHGGGHCRSRHPVERRLRL